MSVEAKSILHRISSWNPLAAHGYPDVSTLPIYPGARQIPPTPPTEVEVPDDLRERSIQPFAARPSSSHLPRLPSPSNLSSAIPVVIPQSSQSRGATFVRAIPTPFPIPQEQFLVFLDALNIAMADSPPMQVFDLVGGVLSFVPIHPVDRRLSFVPIHPVDIVGMGVSIAAQVNNVIIKKVRGDYVVRKANTEVFAPNGYKVEVCSREAMLNIIGGGAMVEERCALVKIDGASRRLMVDERHYIDRAIGGLLDKGVIRRLEFFGLPPPDKKVLNVIDQVAAFPVARKQKQEKKREQKRSVERAELVHTHAFLSGRSSSFEPTGRKQRKALWETENAESKLESKRAKYGVEISRLESDLQYAQSRGDQRSVYRLKSKLAKVDMRASERIVRDEVRVQKKVGRSVQRVERKLGRLRRGRRGS